MAGILDYVRLLKPQQRAEWSIGVCSGASPFGLKSDAASAASPALTRHSLGAVKADGVADPFMLRHGDGWVMFFEIENRRSGRGEIGLASSPDARAWKFEKIVLAEPFHLSYPHVFAHEGAHYMVPESSAASAVRLYKARAFPDTWELHAELLHGSFVDATPFRHQGRWWMIALEGFRRADAMMIFHSERLEGPWLAHPANPVSSHNRRTARPAGRMITVAGNLVRLAQDCESLYGRGVRAYVIEELTTQSYEERPVFDDDRFILGPSGQGWNATGMHHMDAQQLGPHEWVACVDGRRTAWRLPLWDRLYARWLGAGA
jgi:hypothetical protein